MLGNRVKAQGKPITASSSHTEVQLAPQGAWGVVRGSPSKPQIDVIWRVICSIGDTVIWLDISPYSSSNVTDNMFKHGATENGVHRSLLLEKKKKSPSLRYSINVHISSKRRNFRSGSFTVSKWISRWKKLASNALKKWIFLRTGSIWKPWPSNKTIWTQRWRLL